MKSCCGGNGRIGAAAHEIFCWQLKNRELILTSGPRTRTSEVRYSHVRAPNDPLPPSSELPFRVITVRALNIAGFQPKNETEYGDMHDGHCWYLTCFRKIHSDSRLKCPASAQLFTTKGGVQRPHSWVGCRIYRHHDATESQATVRGRETIIQSPVFMFTGRRVGQQPRVVPLSPGACGLNVTLREASEGAGRLNVSSILARRQPRLRAGDTRQSLQPS